MMVGDLTKADYFMKSKKKQVPLIFAKSESSLGFRVYDKRIPEIKTSGLKDRRLMLKDLQKSKEKERKTAEEFFEKVFFANENPKILWSSKIIHRPSLDQNLDGVFWNFHVKYKEVYTDKKIDNAVKTIKNSSIFPKEAPHRYYRPIDSLGSIVPFDQRRLIIEGFPSLEMLSTSSIKGYSVQEITSDEYEQAKAKCNTNEKNLEIFRLESPYQLHDKDTLNDAIIKVVTYLNKKNLPHSEIADLFAANNFDYGQFLNLEELKPKTYPPGVPFEPEQALWYFLDRNRELLKVE